MIYIEELVLEGFESHEHTVIKPSKGLNVIVGETSHGKSSILRALKLIYMNHLRGQALESSINVGAEGFRILIRLSNGYTVVREKNRKTINRYVLIDPSGEETRYTKFTDAPVPAEIQKALGITKRRFEPKNEINFNFLDQIKSSFLIEDTGSKKSKVIGMIRETHYMDQAVREVNKDIRTNESQLKEVKGRMEKVDEDLKKYDYLTDMGEILKEVDALLKKEEVLSQKLTRVAALQADYRQNEELVLRVREESSALKDWLSEPGLTTSCKMDESKGEVASLLRKLNEAGKALEDINKFMSKSKEAAPDIKSATGLSKKISDLEKVIDLFEDYSSNEKKSALYRSVMDDLSGTITAAESFAKQVKRFDEMKDLAKLVDKQKDNAGKLKDAEKVLGAAEKQTNILVEEYGSVLEEMGTCPVCRQHLDKAYVGNIVSGLKVG